MERQLQALAPADRAVLVLRYLEDLTHAEIAALLDVPASTVETRQSANSDDHRSLGR